MQIQVFSVNSYAENTQKSCFYHKKHSVTSMRDDRVSDGIIPLAAYRRYL